MIKISKHSFYHVQHINNARFFLTNMFKGLKRQLSGKIIEKLLNDVTKRRQMSEIAHGISIIF